MAVTIDMLGEVALVTGGSRGLGAATCRMLAHAGAAEAVHYGSAADRAAAVVRGIEAAGGRAMTVGADFHDAVQVQRMMAEVQERLGPITILVNNVGREEALGPALELGWDAYQEMLDLNVRGAYLTSRAAAPGMWARKRGRIINILSMAMHSNPKAWRPILRPKGRC